MRRPRTVVGAIFGSTVGKKAIMATTGVILLLYLIAHMLGNLRIFFGEESINRYAVWLREIAEPLLGYGGLVWVIRVVLTLSVVLHIVTATQLARRARQARPVRYATRPKVQGSYAARTMRWGGVIIALFVTYHVLDLTVGWLNPDFEHGEVYDNIVVDFQHWYVALAYTAAVVVVGVHIRHGVASALRSLGVTTARGERVVNVAAIVFATALVVGFLSVPFSVFFGLVG